MTRPQITTAQYAAILSTIVFFVSCGSLYGSYDLGVTKDEREIRDRMPAVDVQIRPTGASSASVVISIINRADINIAPLDIRVEHSFKAGDLYLSSSQQSLENLRSSLNLQGMGTIPPKGTGTTKATLSGVTDGNLTPELPDETLISRAPVIILLTFWPPNLYSRNGKSTIPALHA